MMRLTSLVYAAFAALTTVNAQQCGEGQWPVSLLGSGTIYCLDAQPCSGAYRGDDKLDKFSCPSEGQPNIDGTVTLGYSTCCGIVPNSNTLGCVRKTSGAQCKGPEPAPYSPKPTPSSTATPEPTTTSSTPKPTSTLEPNATTTVAPNSTTTVAPNATTTLAPNATTLAPNATTLPPNATTTVAPNATTTVAPDGNTTAAPNGTIVTPGATTQSPNDAITTAAPNSNNSTSSDTKKDSGGGISTGAIIGIVVGALALALIVGVVLFRRKQPPPSYMASPVEGAPMTGGTTAGALEAAEMDEALTPRQHVTLL
ncbi:hypothetical protein LEN26_019458 [Aphanomyces euteiches]|nr:hypothetical protein LEN26_019458 [Aphanomyces euteiches]KAH9125889.1 hypothetical protein AeMF1_003576 [Aphanomyces euteiches]KAH9185831.1 hypothetical protein AeNC1_012195 [Aphanomyces euteiches]